MDFIDSLSSYYDSPFLENLSSALRKEPTHCLILNPSKMSEEAFLSLYPKARKHPLVRGAFYYDKAEYDLGKSFFHDVGAFYIQDGSSMLPAYFLSKYLREGSLILDYCSSPGGKSIDCAFMNPSSCILSNDLSYPRQLITSKNIERLGLGNLSIVSGDLAKAKGWLEGKFDAIILDAPCSGSAMMRKNEEAEADWNTGKVLAQSKIQKELLDIAFRFLNFGGYIMYSTCSFSYEEDEGVILDFLSRHEDAEIVPLPVSDGLICHPSLPGSLHAFPHLFEGEGQFLCLIKKKGYPFHSYPSRNTDKEAERLCQSFGIEIPYGFQARINRDSLYLEPEKLGFVSSLPLSTIRLGIKALDLSKPNNPIPDLHYARTLEPSSCIPLNIEEARKYLRGETFPCSSKSGFAVVSYLNLPLGYVKIAGGIAKNHYPKGLRRDYEL